MFTIEEEKKILKFLDRGEWKHSWHLQQREDGHGHEWEHSDKNIGRIIMELRKAKDQMCKLAFSIHEVEEIMKSKGFRDV